MEKPTANLSKKFSKLGNQQQLKPLKGRSPPRKPCVWQAPTESDDGVNEKLRLQFKGLQELEQRRLRKLVEKKKEKKETYDLKEDVPPKTNSFGIEDELKLFQLGSEPPIDICKRLLEDENEQLHDQLREAKGEASRLYRLLQEKDLEIRTLKRIVEEQRATIAGTCGWAGDSTATKIVELSKRNRELNAEREKEKAKVKQLNNKVKELENELQAYWTNPVRSQGFRNSSLTSDVVLSKNPEVKALQQKVMAAQLKMAEYRNQIHAAKQELKIVHKIVVGEVGEDVNIQQLAATSGSWRGRTQIILGLQSRINELETQLSTNRNPKLGLNLDEKMLGHTESCKLQARERNLSQLRSFQKERRDTMRKVAGDHQILLKEHEDLNTKLDASKTRSKVLSNQVKTLQGQLVTVMNRGKHDNELIDVLMQDQKAKDLQKALQLQVYDDNQKQRSLIGQLQEMVKEKEMKMRQLQEVIEQLRVRRIRRIRRRFWFKKARYECFYQCSAKEEEAIWVTSTVMNQMDCGFFQSCHVL